MSEAFLNELTGFPLRIADPDLFKHLTFQSNVHFDTPHHLDICRKFGEKLQATFNSKCHTQLRVIGAEWTKKNAKGYILLEGSARDKNYAQLLLPIIGKYTSSLLLPDHWRTDFVVKFSDNKKNKKPELDKVLSLMSQQRPWPIEVIKTLDLTGYRVRVIFRGAEADIAQAETAFATFRLGLNENLSDYTFTVETQKNLFIPGNDGMSDQAPAVVSGYTEAEMHVEPKKIETAGSMTRIGQRLTSAFRGISEPVEPKGRKRERSENSHVADLPPAKHVPSSLIAGPSSSSTAGPSSSATAGLASTSRKLAPVLPIIEKLLDPSKPTIDRQKVIDMVDEDIAVLESQKEAFERALTDLKMQIAKKRADRDAL